MSHTPTSTLPGPRRIPKERYWAREFADAEMERLWPRVWLHAAPVDLVRQPGQFVTVVLGGQDVLVLRGKDGVVRAFRNACLRRARRLVTDVTGHLDSVGCAIHAWSWDNAGPRPRPAGAAASADLDEEAVHLPELSCALWGGQVWVHLGQPEQSVQAWLAPVAERLQRYDFDDYALTEWVQVEFPCNWKTVLDIFNEMYHLIGTHAGQLAYVDDTTIQHEVLDAHMYGTFTIARASARLAGRNAINDSLAEMLRGFGVDVARLEGQVDRIPEAVRASLRSRGITRLSDEELVSCRTSYLFPSLNFNLFPEMMQIQRHRPHPTDPERMWFDIFTFRRCAAGEARPVPYIKSCVRPGTEGEPGPTIEEDAAEVVEIQRGMHSAGFADLALGGHEVRLIHMHDVIDRYLARPPGT